MRQIDLNCDMGESFGVYRLGLDEEVIKYISSANIACGWHAGDPLVMNHTVRLAAAHGVGVGAHPGFPDLLGFGRRNMDCTADEIRNYVIYQIGALNAFCAANSVRMRHVKPHGNLYNTAVENETVALAIAEAVAAVDAGLMLFALAGTRGDIAAKIRERFGLKVVYEAFADRAYTPEGTLLSRRKPGAVISDPEEVADRAVKMAKENRVTAVDGTEMDFVCQTICVHGDNPRSVELARNIRIRLESEGIAVRPIS
jgi:UPF0271 protein